MGGLYSATVVAGVHHMYTVIDVGQLGLYGVTYWLPLASAANIAQGAATLAVALNCAKKSEPTLRDDMVDFGIPLFANIHLCGSVLTEVFFVMTVSKILYGTIPPVGTMLLFCLLLGYSPSGRPACREERSWHPWG